MTTAKRSRRKATDIRQRDFYALLGDLEAVPMPEEPAREPGAMELDQPMRRWLGEAIDKSARSRAIIAENMASLSGRAITKAQLDSWTGASRPHRFPAELLPAFCAACGNIYVMERLAATMGAEIADATTAKLAHLGRWHLATSYAATQARTLATSIPPIMPAARVRRHA